MASGFAGLLLGMARFYLNLEDLTSVTVGRRFFV